MENIITAIADFFNGIVKWFQDLVKFLRDGAWRNPGDNDEATEA